MVLDLIPVADGSSISRRNKGNRRERRHCTYALHVANSALVFRHGTRPPVSVAGSQRRLFQGVVDSDYWPT